VQQVGRENTKLERSCYQLSFNKAVEIKCVGRNFSKSSLLGMRSISEKIKGTSNYCVQSRLSSKGHSKVIVEQIKREKFNQTTEFHGGG